MCDVKQKSNMCNVKQNNDASIDTDSLAEDLSWLQQKSAQEEE
jgi:hypothetical protein